MKNSFSKNDHTTLIAAIAIASVTAGAVAFLYLTDKGREARKALKKKIKSIAKNAAVDAISDIVGSESDNKAWKRARIGNVAARSLFFRIL